MDRPDRRRRRRRAADDAGRARPPGAERRAEAARAGRRAGHPIEPWDWAFYAEKVPRTLRRRRATPCAPTSSWTGCSRRRVPRRRRAVRGRRSRERPDLPGYHPDVRVFEVSDADGSPLGLFLGDYYARDTKRGGAWMNSFVDAVPPARHAAGRDQQPEHPRPPAGGPTLLTLDEVRTAFHEFGHALHGLLSDVRYPRLSGTSRAARLRRVPLAGQRDVGPWPEVLARYARHHETGEPLPQDAGRQDARGASLRRGLRAPPSTWRAALLDLAWHRLAPDDDRGRPTSRPSRRRAGGGRRRLPPGPPALPQHATSPTSSPAATAPATTPTSGARCSTPTPSSGSRRTAA